MRNEIFTEDLACELTPRERSDRGRQMARKAVELARHLEHAKQLKTELSQKEKTLAAEAQQLAHVVDSGKEARLIDCYERPDARRFEIETVRIDTGETVRARPMDPHERNEAKQGKLFEVNAELMKAYKQGQHQAAVVKVAAVEVSNGGTDEFDPHTGEVIDSMPLDALGGAHPVAIAKAPSGPGSLSNPNPLPQPIAPHRGDA